MDSALKFPPSRQQIIDVHLEVKKKTSFCKQPIDCMNVILHETLIFFGNPGCEKISTHIRLFSVRFIENWVTLLKKGSMSWSRKQGILLMGQNSGGM